MMWRVLLLLVLGYGNQAAQVLGYRKQPTKFSRCQVYILLVIIMDSCCSTERSSSSTLS